LVGAERVELPTFAL